MLAGDGAEFVFVEVELRIILVRRSKDEFEPVNGDADSLEGSRDDSSVVVGAMGAKLNGSLEVIQKRVYIG